MIRPRADESALILIDAQPNVLAPIAGLEALLSRLQYMLKVAGALNVPILATEQVPEKMGVTDERIRPLLPQGCVPIPKSTFGCCECAEFVSALESLGRKQIVLIGIETHICVGSTAMGLIERGYDVVACPDALGARTVEMHKLGMERLRDAGVVPIHTEAVAYEWLGSAQNPAFRDVLKITKQHAG